MRVMATVGSMEMWNVDSQRRNERGGSGHERVAFKGVTVDDFNASDVCFVSC